MPATPGDVLYIDGTAHQALGTLDQVAAINPLTVGVNPSGILFTSRTVTSAELLAIHLTPIELVAAQAGKVIWPVAALAHFRAGAATYLGAPQIAIGMTSAAILALDGTAFITSTSDVIETALSNAEIGWVAADVAGHAIMLSFDAQVTAGDGALDIHLFYRVISVTRPASLVFVQQPTDVVAGATVTPAVTVRVRDQDGTAFTKTTVAITVALTTPGGATLSGTLLRSSVISDGIATFDDLSVDVAGTYTLTATATSGYDGSTLSVESTSFDVTAP